MFKKDTVYSKKLLYYGVFVSEEDYEGYSEIFINLHIVL